jgi:hypothetical protein
METKTLGEAMATALANATTVTELPKPLTADLPNLNNLPDRLGDQSLRQLQTFASSPPPELPPASEKHFLQCMRIMIAALPKKVTDDLGGELVIAAYRRMLGKHPDLAISYLTEQALLRKWFPTIAECNEILAEWQQPPDADRIKAGELARREMHYRNESNRAKDLVDMKSALSTIENMDWLAINTLPQRWLETAFKRGLVEKDGWHSGNPAYKLTGTPGQWDIPANTKETG